MNQLATTGRLAAIFALTLAVSSTGCQSSGGSRWAWNPWKKSAGEEAAALAQSSAPKLPSDGAMPLVEGLPKAKPQPTMVAETKPQTPPAMAGIASTIQAVNAAVPTIEKPAPSSPSWGPNAASLASAPKGIPAMPKSSPAPPPSAMASMPYDPNGYKAASQPSSVAPASTDRYGLSNRYASAAPPSADVSAFGEMPPVAPVPAARAMGDRYELTASADKVAAAVPAAKEAANGFANQTQATTKNTIASAGSRYGAIAPAPASDGAFPFGSAAPPAPTNVPFPNTVAQATSVPVPPTTPAAPAAPYSMPAYPTTKSLAVTAPTQSAMPQSASIGSLPPATSIYASTQPVTPIEPASATTTPQQESKSVVRLTTLPGEYRPGGTSTYRAAPVKTGRY